MSLCCECCVLSGRGLCDKLISRPEESYRLWCVVVCDLETSRMRSPWPALGRSATEYKTNPVRYTCALGAKINHYNSSQFHYPDNGREGATRTSTDFDMCSWTFGAQILTRDFFRYQIEMLFWSLDSTRSVSIVTALDDPEFEPRLGQDIIFFFIFWPCKVPGLNLKKNQHFELKYILNHSLIKIK